MMKDSVAHWTWSVAAVWAILLLTGGPTQAAPQEGVLGRRAWGNVRTFEGVSRRGDFQEALNEALERALRALPGADRLVRYRVAEIGGEYGGLTGRHLLRVVIEVPREAVGRPPLPPIGDADGRLASALRPELRLSEGRVDQQGRVTFTLTARNTSNETLVVPFAGGQQCEFEVWQRDDLVWRWSEGRFFTQALERRRLRPGEAITCRVTWNVQNNRGQTVPPGLYRVRAYLTVRGRGRELAAPEQALIVH